MVPAKSIVTASNSVEPALLGKKNLSPFPDVRTERIILAAEIILPYLSTVMKAIADIKSTIPHFQNPILSAADKYLHATSIRKNTHAAKSANLNIFTASESSTNMCGYASSTAATPVQNNMNSYHPPPGGDMRLFKGLFIVYPAVFSDKNKRAKFLKNCIKKLRFAEFFILC